MPDKKVNKVEFGGDVVMDITDSTVTPETLGAGEVAYNAAGQRIVGLLLITAIDDALSDTSENPVQNKIIKAAIDAVISSIPGVASETVAGTIKLNPNKSITLNASGQLEVGGRMGQFPTTTGLFAPNDRDPRNVADYALLLTDAKGVDMAANRALAVVSGLGTSCKSAPAGSTVYQLTNTYTNRIVAKMAEGGYIAKDEATSKIQTIEPVLSVLIGGQTFTPDSSADSSTPIEIKVANSINPDSAITNIRLFGKMESYASLHIGNGVKSGGSGRSLMIGGGITKANGNDNCMVGLNLYASGNGNAMFGRNHIAKKNRGFFAGTGHDSSNARSESASAVGEYSLITNNTLFAVGNGTSHTSRSNAFEVTSDGGVIIKSSNGIRYKITVDDSGNLNTTAV